MNRSLSFLLESVRKDLRRRLRDPLALVLWLGIPIAIGGLLGLVSGGGGTPTARILLVDQDDTFLTGMLAGVQGQEQLGDFLDLEQVELEEGLARIEAGQATGLVILPEGFTQAVLQEEPSTLTFITNPAQRILPAIVQEGLELLVEAAFYLQRTLGEPLSELADGPPGGASFFADERVAELSADINRRVSRLEHLLFPVVLKLESEVAQAEGEQEEFNFGLFFVPGVLFMALLFVAQGVSEDLWQEKEQGTLRRMLATPHSVTLLLVGKLLVGALLMAAISSIGIAFNVVLYDIPLRVAPAALLWCTFAGTTLLTLFFFLQFCATTRRAGSLLSSVLLFPLMMIGGSFFPFGAMPAWMVEVGRWTPNGQAVLLLTDILREELRTAPLLVATAVLGVFAALLLVGSNHLLRRRFALS